MIYEPKVFEGLLCGQRLSTSRRVVYRGLLWQECDGVFYHFEESHPGDVFLSHQGNWYDNWVSYYE